MGGTSTSTSTQSQFSTRAPWTQAQPFLDGVLDQLGAGLGNTALTGAQNSALNSIEANAGNASQFNPQIGSVVGNLLSGGNADAQAGNLANNLAAYQDRLTPYASGAMIGNNPALNAQLSTIASDVGNSVNGQFAAAGRDFSGLNQQALARGIAQGEAPVLANQYNQDVQRQLNAAAALYGAGNTTSGLLSGLTQQALRNQQAGAALAPAALNAQNAGAEAILAAEAQRRGIPIQALAQLAQIGVPIAGLGSQSTSNGTSQTQNEMSGLQQFGTLVNGIGGLERTGIGGSISNGLSGLSDIGFSALDDGLSGIVGGVGDGLSALTDLLFVL